jgi:hypothetical protein
MCDPISIIGLAFSAASQIMNYNAQMDAAEAQANEQNRRYREAAESGARSLLLLQQTEAQRMNEERVKAGQDAVNLRVDALQQKGTLLAGGDASGSMSQDLLAQDLVRQELNYKDIIGYNLKNVMRQSDMNQRGAVAEQQGMTNQYYPQGVSTPSKGALFVNMGSAALSSYVGYKGSQTPSVSDITPGGSSSSWVHKKHAQVKG